MSTFETFATGRHPMLRNRNLAILFFTMVVVMIGFGIVIPILPFYVESFGVSGKGLGLLMASFSIMQFVFSPVWGALSDRHGRKRVLLLGVLGNGLSLLLMGLSSTYWLLLASRALGGVLSSATLPTAMAFIADSTSDEDRGGGMGVVAAAMGLGMVLGPGVGGWLAADSLATPFYVAAALSIVALALIAAFLPESLPEGERDSATRVRGPQGRQMLRALAGPLGFLLLLSFLVSFAMTSFEGVFGLYVLHRFDYGPTRVGSVLMVIGLVSAAVQFALTGPATRRWGEHWVIRSSLLVSAVGFAMMLGAYNFVTVLVTVGFFVLGNTMLRPAIASLVSKRAEGGQGAAMGLNNAFMSLGRVVGPLWAGALFDIDIGLPYASGALILLVGFGLCVWRLPRRAQARVRAGAVTGADVSVGAATSHD